MGCNKSKSKVHHVKTEANDNYSNNFLQTSQRSNHNMTNHNVTQIQEKPRPLTLMKFLTHDEVKHIGCVKSLILEIVPIPSAPPFVPIQMPQQVLPPPPSYDYNHVYTPYQQQMNQQKAQHT